MIKKQYFLLLVFIKSNNGYNRNLEYYYLLTLFVV
jgi:hypothetical protein